MKAGVWRVLFRRAAVGGNREQGTGDSSTLPVGVPSAVACPSSSVPLELATEYYRLWDPILPAQPGPRDLEQAQALLHDHGTEAKALIACLVRVTKKRWPDCRSLSGAVQKYLPEAVRLHQLERRREAARETAESQRRQEQEMRRRRASRRRGGYRRRGPHCRRRNATPSGAAWWSGWAARRRRKC